MSSQSNKFASSSRAFTLIELLITISIIGLMASMVLFATYSAMETAKEQKTRALIAKLDAIIKAKWDAYKTRRVNVDFGPDRFDDFDPTNPNAATNGNGIWDGPQEKLTVDHNGTGGFNGGPRAYPFPANNPAMSIGNSPLIASMAKMRLDCLRDLMRMELPERWTDVVDDPVAPFDYAPPPFNQWNYAAAFKIPRPAVSQGFLQTYNAVAKRTTPPPPSTADILANQGAECLYMIVMKSLEEEGDSRDVFKSSDIGDVDHDGFPEFIDAWGRPIAFLRWAPGFVSELQIVASFVPPMAMPPNIQDHSYSFTFTPADTSFSNLLSAPIGGVIVHQDTTTQVLKTDSVAPITGRSYETIGGVPTLTLTCTTPTDSYTKQQPFDDNLGGQIGPSGFAVMTPDPFDPAGVYPIYAFQTRTPTITGAGGNLSIPPYSLYPLIYSAGADGQYGIADDLPNPAASPHVYPLRYAAIALYPFYRFTMPSFGWQMIGSIRREGDSDLAWLDNIHNHTQGTR